MSDILVFIYLALLVVGLVLIASSPIMLIMFITNKRQWKYFNMIAKKYNLEKQIGVKKITRDFPLVKGYINGKWTYVMATTVGKFEYSVNWNTIKYSTPITKIGVQLKNNNIKKLSLRNVKPLETGSEISVTEFNEYFELKIETQNDENLIFNDEPKQQIIEFYKKQKEIAIVYNEGSLLAYINYELKKEKLYNEAIEKIELLHKIVEQIE